MALADTIHTYSGYFGGLGFLEVMRPNTWLIYHIDMFIDMFYSASLHYPISVRAIDPVWPSDGFADESDAVPFREAMRHKYSINQL